MSGSAAAATIRIVLVVALLAATACGTSTHAASRPVRTTVTSASTTRATEPARTTTTSSTTLPTASTRPTTTLQLPPPTVAATTAPTTPVTVAPAPTPTPGLAALAGRTIAIDPGHNGDNWEHLAQINTLVNAGGFQKACDTTGTATDSGYSEALFTWNVAQDLKAILTAAGAHVVLTRTSNTGWGPCINQRAAIGNNAHADAAVSIHADGAPATGRGFQVLYPPASGITAPIAGASQRLAHDLQAALVGAGIQPANYAGTGDGLIARSDLGGLNLSQVPKDFVECGNMRNASEAALLTSPTYQQRLASAIAQALAAFLSGH